MALARGAPTPDSSRRTDVSHHGPRNASDKHLSRRRRPAPVLALLADVVQRYALRCHAYCEMTNHYHLAVTTTEANLSRALQQLNGDYAQWWNWRHQRVGHVFQARFNAQIVQDDAYLVNVCRYIVLNPVRAGIVCSPELWPWSSYRAMAGLARSHPSCTAAGSSKHWPPAIRRRAGTSSAGLSWRRTLARCSSAHGDSRRRRLRRALPALRASEPRNAAA